MPDQGDLKPAQASSPDLVSSSVYDFVTLCRQAEIFLLHDLLQGDSDTMMKFLAYPWRRRLEDELEDDEIRSIWIC